MRSSGQSVELIARGEHRLVRRVDHQVAAGIEINLHRVLAAVAGRSAPLEISERAREHVEIVGQGRSEERQADLGAGAGEFINRARRQHFEPRLREFVTRLPLAPHDAIALAIDARVAR